MIDVLIATLGEREPAGLEQLGDYRVLTSRVTPWAVAANMLLGQAENDVLFLDDDITLEEDILTAITPYYDKADIFGFLLCSETIKDGYRSYTPASWGFTLNKSGLLPLSERAHPSYVAHATASCLYIKQHVLKSGLRFPLWPGTHYEDVAFTVDAWLRGFKVLYLPCLVGHALTEQGAGQTKSQQVDLERTRAINRHYLSAWMLEHDVYTAIDEGRIPSEPWKVTP